MIRVNYNIGAETQKPAMPLTGIMRMIHLVLVLQQLFTRVGLCLHWTDSLNMEIPRVFPLEN